MSFALGPPNGTNISHELVNYSLPPSGLWGGAGRCSLLLMAPELRAGFAKNLILNIPSFYPVGIQTGIKQETTADSTDGIVLCAYVC